MKDLLERVFGHLKMDDFATIKEFAESKMINRAKELLEVEEHWKQPKPWPQENDEGWFVDEVGNAKEGIYKEFNCTVYVKAGNFFKTEEDAKASALYTLLNSEYNYYVPGTGQPEPQNIEGLEYYSEGGQEGVRKWMSTVNIYSDEVCVHRWPKAGQ